MLSRLFLFSAEVTPQSAEGLECGVFGQKGKIGKNWKLYINAGMEKFSRNGKIFQSAIIV